MLVETGSIREQWGYLRMLPCGSLHVNFHAHPGMDAALEQMLSLRQTSDIEMAALKNPGLGHRDFGKAAGTFRNDAGCAARVERRQESVIECFHLREGVRLAALIDHGKDVSLADRHLVRFEVPTRIRCSSLRPGK